MTRGKHDVKVGMGIRINQMNVRAEGFQDGFWVIGGAWTSDKFAFAGSSMADLLLGMSSLRIHDQNLNGDITGRRWKLFRPFVQDDWRVNKNLTVNLGLAWGLATPISEAKGRMADYIPAATSYQWLIPSPGCTTALQAIATCKNSGAGAGVKIDYSPPAPRIGLAWKKFGSGETGGGAGFAIFHHCPGGNGGSGLVAR